MAKAIIFGSNGQDGYYLRQLLVSAGIQVVGVARSGFSEVTGSVGDPGLVRELVREVQPDFIFHLAANSSTSYQALWDNHEAIATGSLNILEAVYKDCKGCRIFLSGSALQFENKNEPIDESAKLVATSPYVISRNYSLQAARYFRSLGIQVFFGYLFNHDSPQRGERHMAQKIARYCLTLEDQAEPLTIGNIEVRKEWTFAGDVVNAIWQLMNQQNEFEVVIGSGKAYSIRDWLEACFSHVGKDWSQYVRLNPDFVPEYKVLVSNPHRLHELGWRPLVDFHQLAKMMMNV